MIIDVILMKAINSRTQKMCRCVMSAAVAARRQGLARAAALLQRGSDLRLRGQLTWFASSLLLN